MKCPTCGVWSEVSETRAHTDFINRRTRRCANEHVWTTYEITAAAFQYNRARIEAHSRKPGRRIPLSARDRQIRSALAAGVPVAEVAIKYELSLKQVYRIRRGTRR